MNTKVILKSVGTCLKYASFVFLIPIIIAIIYGEFFAIPYFFLSFLISLILGFALEKIFYTDRGTRLDEGFVIIALIWLLIALLSTIPFVFVGGTNFIDALFESMSAWTTTGFSLLDLESVPQSILFWRSFGQWIGGIGIVVLALSGLFKTSNTLYIMEGHERIKPNVINAVKTIWWIYIFYTIVGIA
ncbi:MAG: TrkH family potassium uptake protein, partial [Candidatus Aenigmarchaeota archaeon]|nr:TrkH family potassium uptake protein [Candidatus Aenigmarchaeota archaeon]